MDWLLVVGVAGLAALAVRGLLRGSGLPPFSFGMGPTEIVVILAIILLVIYWAARRR